MGEEMKKFLLLVFLFMLSPVFSSYGGDRAVFMSSQWVLSAVDA
jgi:hypothetical protein